MRRNAIVVKLEGECALISVARASACEGCHRASEGCSACSLLGGDRRHLALVQNPIGAKIGERVTVEASDAAVLGYAALIFLFPVLAALVLFLLFTPLFSEGSPYAFLIALGGFLLAFLAVFCVSATLSRRKPLSVIVACLSNEGDCTVEKSEFES